MGFVDNKRKYNCKCYLYSIFHAQRQWIRIRNKEWQMQMKSIETDLKSVPKIKTICVSMWVCLFYFLLMFCLCFSCVSQAKQSLATLTKDVPKRHSLAMPTEPVVNGSQEWVMQADLPLTAAIRQSQQTLYHGHTTDRQGRLSCPLCLSVSVLLGVAFTDSIH